MGEWTRADVLRVMREKAEPIGAVHLSDVKASFNLNTPKANEQFRRCVDQLKILGDYTPIDDNRGWVSRPEGRDT